MLLNGSTQVQQYTFEKPRVSAITLQTNLLHFLHVTTCLLCSTICEGWPPPIRTKNKSLEMSLALNQPRLRGKLIGVNLISSDLDIVWQWQWPATSLMAKPSQFVNPLQIISQFLFVFVGRALFARNYLSWRAHADENQHKHQSFNLDDIIMIA